MRCVFVAPPWDAFISGGNLYNEALVSALRARGSHVQVISSPEMLDLRDPPELVWFDSLFLDAVPAMQRDLSERAVVGLLLHYLPAFVALGRAPSWQELSDVEQQALLCADTLAATSPYMRDIVATLVGPSRPVVCFEPGLEIPPEVRSIVPEPPPVHAIVIANLVAGKGVAPLLEALARQVRDDDRFVMTVVGSHGMEPEYARTCEAIVANDERLRERVIFTGSLEQSATLARLASSHLLLSASRMESYGMALASARALRVPILARSGGNVAFHVHRSEGGTLVEDDEDLAAAFFELVRDTRVLASRRELARASSWAPLPWSLVAEGFAAFGEGLRRSSRR